jgi:hypothetical protein
VSHGPGLARYLVELEPPSTGWGDLQQLTARARAAVEELRGEGMAVRFLRSIYVPEDESCFFLYEGDSVASVGAAGRRAQLQIVRIAETLRAELK